MEVNLLTVILATVAMFAVGAFWYMVLFAKEWGAMHGFNKLSKEEQKSMQSKMGPLYGAQLVVTILSAWVLAVLIGALPSYSPYVVAFVVWAGFVVPAQVSAVIFGGTEPRYVLSKILIMSGEALAHLQAAALVIYLLK